MIYKSDNVYEDRYGRGIPAPIPVPWIIWYGLVYEDIALALGFGLLTGILISMLPAFGHDYPRWFEYLRLGFVVLCVITMYIGARKPMHRKLEL